MASTKSTTLQHFPGSVWYRSDLSLFVGDTSGVSGFDVAYGISGSVPVGAATNIVASYAGGGDRRCLTTAFGIGFTQLSGWWRIACRGMVSVNTAYRQRDRLTWVFVSTSKLNADSHEFEGGPIGSAPFLLGR